MFNSELNIIKSRMLIGELTYEQAKELSKPIIDSMNEKSKEIAKKYNKKPAKLNFAGIMR